MGDDCRSVTRLCEQLGGSIALKTRGTEDVDGELSLVNSTKDTTMKFATIACGLALGTEICAGDVVAGRVAVAGGGFVWAATS
jgi:hypothetical protein